MTKKFAVLVGLFLYSIMALADQKASAPESVMGAKTVIAEDVIELMMAEPDVTIIDSRKNSEYLKGHIEGAISILNTTMTQDELEIFVPDKNSAIIFYCNGSRCLRSSDSARKALSWGYENIYWFRGGWKEWLEKKFPIQIGENN
ncbi:MAG: rhodanese-like domain-containing protein [Gammaproteobacteria bacterium]|nr:rhodanese-like domain-containing protein [Gammaproteobacteria bacterium]